MFKKQNEKAGTVEVFDLSLSFESGFMVLSAGGLRFRLRREDVALMANPSALERAFDNSGKPVDRREFDAAAIERFCKISRFLSHGLDFGRIGKLINESESNCRAFYGWGLSQGGAYENVVTAEKQKQDALDILPLTSEKVWTGAWGLHKEIRINGSQLKKLLAQDGDAAGRLGVQRADLDKWLGDNADMMALLK